MLLFYFTKSDHEGLEHSSKVMCLLLIFYYIDIIRLCFYLNSSKFEGFLSLYSNKLEINNFLRLLVH